MRIAVSWALAAALALGAVATAPHEAARAADAPARAVCPVCRVKEGTREAEDVRAVRTHEGIEYGFCAEACARAFDADPAAYVPPRYPAPAPPLRARTLDGAPLAWDGFAGRLVLVDFWATWCAPCRESMPELQTLHERYADRGLTVLGISIDEGGAGKVKKHVRRHRYTYPMAIDPERDPTWEAFRVKAIPAAYLVNGRGEIVASWRGRVDIAEIERAVLAHLPAAD